jgi:hypothetical protein
MRSKSQKKESALCLEREDCNMKKLILLTLAALVSTIAIVTATDNGDVVQLTNFGDVRVVPVAVEKDQLIAFGFAGKLDATDVLTWMIKTGKILPVKSGTKVRVVDYGETTQVRIFEGKYSGRTGWVFQECVGHWVFND